MQSVEIRQKFLTFFQKRQHAILPSAPLVPENDPSILFNTAGMQPLVPYLMGSPHPSGKRLVNSQKCVRTGDIDEVGDNTHDTFFEMLGNWSLGDYFKEEAIKWSFEFLTSKEEGLGLDAKRLYVTVFEGNDDAPRDNEALEIWKKYVPENRIYFMSAKSNWWSPGDNGPCGPDTEMFYDVTERGLGDLTKEEYKAADDRQDIVEIWNDVFMEYVKKDGKVVDKLTSKNVDTGSGLERVVMAIQGKNNIFDTDLFAPIMDKIAQLAGGEIKNLRAARIVADHIRTSVMLIADGVRPSNTDQGYILRRLIRRAVRYADMLNIEQGKMSELVPVIAEKYKGVYDNVAAMNDAIVKEIQDEEEKFRKTLERGTKELTDLLVKGSISGVEAFTLFSTYGFPFELTLELAREKGVEINKNEFEEEMKKHQELSRTSSAGKFKGGLANASEKTIMFHTATHIMLAGLQKYLGKNVHQAGSNITEERLRFDFTYPEKVAKETLSKVEEYVNEAIKNGCSVETGIMEKDAAMKAGVEGSFWEKYPDKVTVYTVKGSDGTVYSQELCGGPHVVNTGNIKGKFKIVKEEASSAGVRRIKAVLE